MIKIMAEENMDSWKSSPMAINEAVLAMKEYLDGELAKYDTFGASNETIKRLVDKFNFDKVKKEGIGRTILKEALGGNWKDWMIQEAKTIV
jgi:hypothetical protein